VTDIADRSAVRGVDAPVPGPDVDDGPPSPVPARPVPTLAVSSTTATVVGPVVAPPSAAPLVSGTAAPEGRAHPEPGPLQANAPKPGTTTPSAKVIKSAKSASSAKEAKVAKPTAGGPAPEEANEPDTSGDGFAQAVSAKLRTYVYLLVDPRTGRPFYAGRGRGDRCFRHLRAARAATGSAPDEQARFPVLDKIRDVESGGRPVRIDILRYGLSAAEASLVEAAANDALGLPVDSKLGSQRGSVDEVKSLLAKRAKFKRGHQVVLLRVGGTGTDPAYELVRHSWRIGRRWIDLDSPRSPQWAVVVVGELAAGVYRLEAWEPTRRGAHSPKPAGGTRSAIDRYSFVGTRDTDLETRYVGRSVAPYLGASGQSPVTYVWCGPHWVNTPH
jgi:hypothetical protein